MVERSVLDEAIELTRGDRNRDYGHPSDDYGRSAAMVSAYLGHTVTARQLMGCMILVKMSRQAHTPDHWDSAVDIAGYADCIGRDIERERLAAAALGGPRQHFFWTHREPTATEPVNQTENTGGSPLNVHPDKTAGYPPAETMVWEATGGLTRRGGNL